MIAYVAVQTHRMVGVFVCVCMEWFSFFFFPLSLSFLCMGSRKQKFVEWKERCKSGICRTKLEFFFNFLFRDGGEEEGYVYLLGRLHIYKLVYLDDGEDEGWGMGWKWKLAVVMVLVVLMVVVVVVVVVPHPLCCLGKTRSKVAARGVTVRRKGLRGVGRAGRDGLDDGYGRYAGPIYIL